MDYSSKELIKHTKILIVFCVILNAILFCFGWFDSFNFTEDDQHTWFQRSGALITAFSVYCELMVKQAICVSGNLEHYKKDKNITRLAQVIAFIFLLLGTVIWGYGDLIYLYFKP